MKNKFISKVFAWLFIGLLVTFGLGYAITLNEQLTYSLISNFGFIALAEIVIGIGFSLLVNKISNTTAKILYLLYAALTGVTFTVIFLAYEVSSIVWVFLATALIFGVLALVGKKIKIDLTGFGTFLLIALLGMIVLAIINIFIANEALDLTVCFVSLFIFAGYIVFDINRIIKLGELNLEDKYAVFWAFQLYLDIINIIIKLLRLFGDSRD